MKKFLKCTLIAISVMFVILTVGVIFGALYLLQYRDNKIDESLLSSNSISHMTEFYRYEFEDRGKRLGNASLIESAKLNGGIKYKYTSFEELPDNLINAFIAIEDKRFYDHDGIDWLRTGKAAINLVFGSKRFGGSTITQQLVKNLTGDNEISVGRKLGEAFAARDLEERLDKTQILECYLNIINLSDGCRGVGAASAHFYSKNPKELTLSECATIAAITNNPSFYNPRRAPQNTQTRRNTVLYCMLEQGYISKREYENAINEPISLNVKNDNNNMTNSWYIDMVIDDVIDGFCTKYGVSKSYASLMLYRGGYKIYTAMDEEIQNILNEYYKDVYNFPIDEEGKTAQSSMIIIDPYTGDILGVAGAVGKKSANRIQNFATNTKRPPASALKPLSVYAPALEMGLINWSTEIEDSPVKILNGTPWPQNVDKKYVGKTDIRYAIDHSLNTVAVKVLEMVGAENSMNFLRQKLLLETLDEKKDLCAAALSLGQPTNGVTLRALTAAYSIFSEGIMSKPRSFYRVTDSKGNIILDNPCKQESVISRETAAIMTKLLESVVENGTAAGKVTLDNTVDVAGKSGTSQNNCDRYFIGYTPELLGGVWFGYDYPKNLEVFGGNLSVYIWDDVMKKIYSDTEYGIKTRFTVPDNVQRLSYYNTQDELASDEIPIANDGWFISKAHKSE